MYATPIARTISSTAPSTANAVARPRVWAPVVETAVPEEAPFADQARLGSEAGFNFNGIAILPRPPSGPSDDAATAPQGGRVESATPPPSAEPDAESLHLTEPDEPDEVEADHFASAALEAMSRAGAAAEQGAQAGPSPGATPAPFAPAAPAPAPLPLAEAGAPDAAEELEEPKERQERAERRALTPASGADDGDGGGSGSGSGGLVGPLGAAATGFPLGAAVRDRIEPFVGMDLSRIRIHADAESARLAERFQARAFAYRAEIYFAPGEYAPHTRSGLHLLLHEIAHVVQQAASPPAAGLIARGPLSGAGVHKHIERILTEAHSSTNLIAEGVLPGGSRGGTDLHKLGYPDLYRSTAGNKVPWVRGESQTDGSLKYVPLKLDPYHGHPKAKAGKSEHEPTVDATETFTGDFPARFEVAEIKPIGLAASGIEKAGEGFAQSNNYLDGLPAFAKQAKTDGKSSVVPVGSSLTTVKNLLPPAIDYNNFKTDAANPKPAKPNLVFGKRRYWVYPLQKHPTLFYFDLPHPYALSDYTKALDGTFAELEGLKKRLGTKQTPTKVKLKAAHPRRRRIARKTDWKAQHTAWEADRDGWDTRKAKPYLKTDAAKAVEEKAKVDRKVGLPAADDPQGAALSRKHRQIELFSGKTGKILGDIRYALAPVFDKLTPLFEWLKKKLGGLAGKLKQGKKLALSWAQVIFDAALKALATTAQEAIALLFGKFQDCIMGMVDNFIDSFVRDLTEELTAPFEEARKAFLSWLGVDEGTFGQFMTDIEASIAKYEKIVDTILDAKRIVNEIKVYEIAIRGIVQAISCVSPPVAGCLWGAIAQLGLPALVDLAITSDLFQDRVVRPLVRDWVKDILDEPFSRIVSTSIDAIGLGKWAKGVPVCKITPLDVKAILDQAISPGLKLDDPALLKKRGEWDKTHEREILDAGAKQFVKKDGKPVTPGELKALLEQLPDLTDKGASMQEAIAQATRADDKIDFDRFGDWAKGKIGAKPQPSGGGGGWTSDGGGSPDPAQVKAKLDKLDLAKVSAGRMVELMEDARDPGGRVNVDQFARKVEMHLERRQIKRDVEAQEPSLPGVPKQPERGFSDAGGGEPSKDAMRELVDSLARANLGEKGGAEKVEEARRPDGTVDAASLKGTIDTAASGAPGTTGAAPGTVPPPAPSGSTAPREGEKPVRPDIFLHETYTLPGGGRDPSESVLSSSDRRYSREPARASQAAPCSPA